MQCKPAAKVLLHFKSRLSHFAAGCPENPLTNMKHTPQLRLQRISFAKPADKL